MIWLGFSLLLAISALAKACVDVMSHQPDTNLFAGKGKWWDARVSWKNKYKNYDAHDLRPAFLGSTGALVFLTDFWHFADFVYLTSWQVAAVLWLPLPWYYQLAALVVIKVWFGLVFETPYKKWFRLTPSV